MFVSHVAKENSRTKERLSPLRSSFYLAYSMKNHGINRICSEIGVTHINFDCGKTPSETITIYLRPGPENPSPRTDRTRQDGVPEEPEKTSSHIHGLKAKEIVQFRPGASKHKGTLFCRNNNRFFIYGFAWESRAQVGMSSIAFDLHILQTKICPCSFKWTQCLFVKAGYSILKVRQ